MKFDKIFSEIFKSFPPPKFLDIPFAGLAISDRAIHCIQFAKKNDSLYIEKYTEKDIPVGVVTSGQINNKEALTTLLSDLKKELNLKYVKVSLPEEKGYLFTAKIPMVESAEVVSAIESKIEENVPVPGGELCFDYKLVEHQEKEHLDVVVSAVPISVVDSYVEAVTLSGLSPLSLEIESQSITRALLPKKSKGTVLIVNFTTGKVGLYVATNRVVSFTSTVAIGGEVSKNPNFLAQEIKKLYIYWHTLKDNAEKPERKINQIIVCGVGFPKDIIQYLSSTEQSSIVLGSVWTNIFDFNVHVPEISFDKSLAYATAIGLALPSEILIRDPLKT